MRAHTARFGEKKIKMCWVLHRVYNSHHSLQEKKKERVERTPGKTLRFTAFRHTRARKYSNSAARQHFHENLTPEKHNTRNKKWAYLEGIKRHRYLKETMQKVNRIGTNGLFGHASTSRQKRSYHGTQTARETSMRSLAWIISKIREQNTICA